MVIVRYPLDQALADQRYEGYCFSLGRQEQPEMIERLLRRVR